MQLVNIETPRDVPYVRKLVESVAAGDRKAALNSLLDEPSAQKVLRSFHLLAVRSYDPQLVLLTDAVSDLYEQVFKENPDVLFENNLAWYLGVDYREIDISPLVFSGEGLPPAVMVSDLEEALDSGNHTGSLLAARNILAVIEAKTYFREIILNTISRWYLPQNELLPLANAVFKGIDLFGWEIYAEQVRFLIDQLTAESVTRDKIMLEPVSEAADYARLFVQAVRQPGDNFQNVLLISHARQVYRGASARHHETWPRLNALLERIFSGAVDSNPATIEKITGTEADFAKGLAQGNVEYLTGLSASLMQDEPGSVNTIFGHIFRFLFNGSDQPGADKIIILNAARRAARALKSPRNVPVMKFVFQSILNLN
jgi:hypothetical protein